MGSFSGSVSKFGHVWENIQQFNILQNVSEPLGNDPDPSTEFRFGKRNPPKYLVTEGSACVERPHYTFVRCWEPAFIYDPGGLGGVAVTVFASNL